MNHDIAKTAITDKVRVSSAIIHYQGMWFGDYYQYETLTFSSDPSVKFNMVIHGTDSEPDCKLLIDKALKVHNHISNNLTKKLIINN